MPLSRTEYANAGDSELLQHIKVQRWDDAMNCLKEQAHIPDEYHNFPLHVALGYQAPDTVVLALLQHYPDATRQHGSDDWLPLHVAAMYGCSVVVMDALIRSNPCALDDRGQTSSSSNNNTTGEETAKSIKGRTPRHFAGRFEHNRPLLERSTDEWQQLIAATAATTTRTPSSDPTA